MSHKYLRQSLGKFGYAVAETLRRSAVFWHTAGQESDQRLECRSKC
jgi:hypothetical protein